MSEQLRAAEEGEAGYPVMPAVGEQLRAAREARGLSLDDVSQVLKLGVRQVEALENGDWHGLPGNTFIRGFVRNYARLVHVDGAALMTQLDTILEPPKASLELPATTPASMPVATSSGRSRDFAVALFGIGLVGVAFIIYFLMPGGMADLQAALKSVAALVHPAEQPVPPAAVAVPEPVMPPGATTQQVLNPQAQPVTEPAAAAQPATASPTAPMPPAPANVAAGIAAGGGVPMLRLVFDKDSWVEVRDRNSKVIFSQKGAPGSDFAVDGEGPLAVVVGYAPGVRLQLRGQPVDLAPYTRGDVARLTLD